MDDSSEEAIFRRRHRAIHGRLRGGSARSSSLAKHRLSRSQAGESYARYARLPEAGEQNGRLIISVTADYTKIIE